MGDTSMVPLAPVSRVMMSVRWCPIATQTVGKLNSGDGALCSLTFKQIEAGRPWEAVYKMVTRHGGNPPALGSVE